MIKTLFVLILLTIVTGCKRHDKALHQAKTYADIQKSGDTLFSIRNGENEYGSTCAYRNKKGDIIIQAGKYSQCFTDTFRTYAIVSDLKLTNSEMVAINRNEEIVFDVYLFDNGPDYPSEGLFRVKRNGKIGFANLDGEIVIEPVYACAFPFEDHKAKVSMECELIKADEEHTAMESTSWFYIDHEGKRIP